MALVDLKPDNIMVEPENSSIFEPEVQSEYHQPLPQKTGTDGRTLYFSRSDFGATVGVTGWVELTDFGYSVLGTSPQSGPIQAEVYRAPEVILDAGYSYSADIWNLGVMVCHKY